MDDGSSAVASIWQRGREATGVKPSEGLLEMDSEGAANVWPGTAYGKSG